jgi:hypothetical protein
MMKEELREYGSKNSHKICEAILARRARSMFSPATGVSTIPAK